MRGTKLARAHRSPASGIISLLRAPFAGLARRRSIRLVARRYGYDDVLALFVFALRHAKEHPVLLDPEFSLLADGEEGRVLLVLGTDAVSHAIGAQPVLLAKHFAGLLVL